MTQQQKGIMLIEIVLALGIVGAVGVSIVMAIMTLMINYQQPVTQQFLLQQVRSTSYWIPRDINMANDVTLSAPNGFPFTVNIPVDQDQNNDYTVDYLFDGNTLKRQQYDSSDNLTAENVIAQYVNTDNTTFESITQTLHKLTIRVSMGEEAVTASYEVQHRL